MSASLKYLYLSVVFITSTCSNFLLLLLLLFSIEFIRPPNQLLSVASVALNNCDCTLPIFIPTQERTRKYYVGMSVPGSRGAITIRYESDEMRLNPNSMLTNLSG